MSARALSENELQKLAAMEPFAHPVSSAGAERLRQTVLELAERLGLIGWRRHLYELPDEEAELYREELRLREEIAAGGGLCREELLSGDELVAVVSPVRKERARFRALPALAKLRYLHAEEELERRALARAE